MKTGYLHILRCDATNYSGSGENQPTEKRNTFNNSITHQRITETKSGFQKTY